MKQYLCRVIEHRTLWADVQSLAFDAPDLARAIHPGQFALARDATTLDPYLRRVLWLYAVEGERVAFVLPAYDPLAARARVGDTLDLLAPLGRAIQFDATVRRVLLISEGTRVAPLIVIAHDLVQRGCEVVLMMRATSANAVFPVHLLAPEIEYRTDDDVLSAELVAWADAIVASGSDELYRALADTIRAVRYRLEPEFARVFVDTPMPCGTGACYVCAVETTRGIQQACADGPSFDLSELENRRT